MLETSILKQIVELWKPLLAILAALFFAFKFYYEATEVTHRMDDVVTSLNSVMKQAEDNSRKMELGFVQMGLQIDRNREDIALYLRRVKEN